MSETRIEGKKEEGIPQGRGKIGNEFNYENRKELDKEKKEYGKAEEKVGKEGRKRTFKPSPDFFGYRVARVLSSYLKKFA